MKRLIALLIIFPLNFSLAASDTFTIRTQIGSDDLPPSTPTDLEAVVVSTSQIDLSWGPSTDNYTLGGYQIYRDAVVVATTTMTSYSDTGLLPNTSYSYFVRAFDSSYNYSSSSNVVATSTLAIPIVDDDDGSSGGGEKISLEVLPIELNNLQIITETDKVQISFDTNIYTKVLWRWGRTINYEGGYINTDSIKKSHKTSINNLLPGSLYQLEISLVSRFGDETLNKRLEFRTKSLPDSTSQVPNVSNFRTVLNDNNEVSLSWELPKTTDIASVRVLASNLFYPNDERDGYIVFEGLANQVIDQKVLESGFIRYYTIFTFDNNGNRSSGAVSLVANTDDFREVDPVGEITEIVTDLYEYFTLEDLSIVQDKNLVPMVDNMFIIDRSLPTSFKIPYESLPEHLKSILITLTNQTEDKDFTFLLSIDEDKENYTALIEALPKLGLYEIRVEVFDYKNQTVRRLFGDLLVVAGSQSENDTVYVTERLKINWPIVFSFILILFIFLVYLRLRIKSLLG